MKEHTQQDYQGRMLNVLLYIQHHLDSLLSLRDLAALAHFSPYHFHRVFKGMVGETVMEHVRRLRLERAAGLLKRSRLPVTQIAMEAGYETHESFLRAFRDRFGLTPSQYRRQGDHQAMPVLDQGRRQGPWPQPNQQGGLTMEVEIKRLAPCKVAFVRHVGPYHECGRAWEKLCAWAGPKGLLGPQARFLGLCHDDPEVTPPDKVRYDACLAIQGDMKPEGEVGVQEIAGGDYGVTLHRGPYENLAQTYAQLCGVWAPASGRGIRSLPSFEVYLNDPGSTPPADLLVEIHLPLEPR